ncbi:MAG TPA: TadE family protein [Candidatus Limnocylindrales bacterium]
MSRSVAGTEPKRERGQSLVELAISMPVFLLLLLGMLEFGFAFTHHLTLEYATREGARTGAALANGSAEVSCSSTPNVDDYVIAAVQRVLTSPGSQVSVSQVSQIAIYRSSATGTELTVNLWVPGTGPTVDGEVLQFTRSGATNWSPCSRNNGNNPDSIGVRISYRYRYVTPMGSLMGLAGNPTMPLTDRTIMALNPD